jgi:hypothetical protein
MYKVACPRRELSGLIGNLFSELVTLCTGDYFGLKDDDLVLSGIIMGTDKKAAIKLTDYGCECHGDVQELERLRGKRCLIRGAFHATKES